MAWPYGILISHIRTAFLKDEDPLRAVKHLALLDSTKSSLGGLFGESADVFLLRLVLKLVPSLVSTFSQCVVFRSRQVLGMRSGPCSTDSGTGQTSLLNPNSTTWGNCFLSLSGRSHVCRMEVITCLHGGEDASTAPSTWCSVIY